MKNEFDVESNTGVINIKIQSNMVDLTGAHLYLEIGGGGGGGRTVTFVLS